MKPASISQDEIAALFAHNEPAGSGDQVTPAAFPTLQAAGEPGESTPIGLLANVELEVTVQLGSTRKNIREILACQPGSVLELDRMAGDTVDILVNGRLVARGEVVVIGENFGVRVTELHKQERGGQP